MEQDKQINFENQNFFIGLDTHLTNWKVTVRSNGIELKTMSMDPSPQQLCKYMHRNYPGGIYNSVYEAGFCGFWIHRELANLGFNNIVINPADVPTKHKEKKYKRDKVDSRKLARELENGSLEAIYIPDESIEHLRALHRLRYQIVKSKTRIKNRIKSLLHFHGVPIVERSEISHWSGRFIKWLRSIQFSYEPGNENIQILIDELEYQRSQLTKVIRSLRKYCQELGVSEIIDLIRSSVPGIGMISAVTLYLEIIDINRFKGLDNLACFVGLIPSADSSDDTDKDNQLTSRRNKYLRHILIEAAWVAVRKDPALTMAFNKLTRRMIPQKAICRIAKKLLNRIRYVWKNKQPYVSSVVQ